jgi:hypothetical protein
MLSFFKRFFKKIYIHRVDIDNRIEDMPEPKRDNFRLSLSKTSKWILLMLLAGGKM